MNRLHNTSAAKTNATRELFTEAGTDNLSGPNAHIGRKANLVLKGQTDVHLQSDEG